MELGVWTGQERLKSAAFHLLPLSILGGGNGRATQAQTKRNSQEKFTSMPTFYWATQETGMVYKNLELALRGHLRESLTNATIRCTSSARSTGKRGITLKVAWKEQLSGDNDLLLRKSS